MAGTDLFFTISLLAGFHRGAIEGYYHYILFPVSSGISCS